LLYQTHARTRFFPVRLGVWWSLPTHFLCTREDLTRKKRIGCMIQHVGGFFPFSQLFGLWIAPLMLSWGQRFAKPCGASLCTCLALSPPGRIPFPRKHFLDRVQDFFYPVFFFFFRFVQGTFFHFFYSPDKCLVFFKVSAPHLELTTGLGF